MNKLLIGFALFLLTAFANAQSGLEQIVVEKYYVSNAADSAGSVGLLPSGSITWRIYADLAAGYTLQAVYGVDVAPFGPTLTTGDHYLKFNTTTSFFNNEDYGSTNPNGISVTNTRKNSVMLDTWFSMSGNAQGKAAVLKTDDNDGALVNSTNPIILQNNDCSSGFPINSRDGMIAGTPPTVTFVGFSGVELAVFDNQSQVGNAINTNNASIAVLGGVTGPTSANRVLIGQFTTTGTFHYELNLQLGTPTLGVEKWVASNPVTGEYTMASLTGTYAPNTPPTVNITSPANNSTYLIPQSPAVVNITVNATDNSAVTKVVLIDNNVRVDSLTSGGPNYNFTRNYTVVGNHALTAEATDDNCGVTTSTIKNVIIGNNIPPTISITSPANGTPFVAPASVNIVTNASDVDGTVSQVEFFVDNVSVGIDNTSPFTFNWTSGAPFGARHLKAIATDNNGATTTSSVITINVSDPNALDYGVVNTSSTCVSSTFCVPVEARHTVNNVIGYDVVMHYDSTKVVPTGIVSVDNDLVNPNYVDVSSSINAPSANVNISVYFNGSAPAGSRFHGTGNIFCVQFVKLGTFSSVDTGVFSLPTLQESYITGVAQVPADPGRYSTYRDTSFGGHLAFWSNSSPIRYNSGNPTQYLITNIYGTDNNCANQSITATQPNVNGDFTYNTTNGAQINIKKDIASSTNIQPVVNGFDAFLTKRVLMNDASFVPSVFQMIAMDVNLDGVISSGDLSQINQRTVAVLPEYQQYWNYDASGNPISGAGPSKDWIFVDNTRLNTSAYQISFSYPANDGVGYSKYRVPQVPFCLPLPSTSTDTSGNCQILVTETYKGVLLGDVNGNYASVSSNLFRANETESVIFDLTKAVTANGYVDVPVSILSLDAINSLDFAMKFNQSKMSFNAVNSSESSLEGTANVSANDNTLRYTSFSMQKIEAGKKVATVRFNTTGAITKDDFNSLEGYLNGERVGVNVNDGSVDYRANVFPNPANEILNVITTEDAKVELMSIDGSKVLVIEKVIANQKLQINTGALASGVYMLKISNDNFVSTNKVVIQK